jgi:CheY-like chemotaxis protein
MSRVAFITLRLSAVRMNETNPHKILLVEDDLSISELVRVVLTDEGYAVRVAVNQPEPDCVLLDSGAGSDYGESWETAAWAHARSRPVPVLMLSAHAAESLEAEVSRAAALEVRSRRRRTHSLATFSVRRSSC